ncbi:MAG: UDP-N-acetylmuramoyl-tripeptide--D-alanyl-D-alanine ligase [Armatimonadetes bacterium]|nr:UDP-N-acetylmuramoyl-tripeptide--D-alanyl-D-alanine ligase [Armatimonadota bacterium]
MIFQLSELASRCGGVMVGDNSNFSGFSLDNRDTVQGNVFIAIKGERVDGHNFVASAFEHGAVCALVDRAVPFPHILVPEVVAALGKLGNSIRKEFHGPVVGITGSNGKTTAKEMSSAVLGALGPVLKNTGNQNSEYTSPLTWTRLTPEHKSAVIEMGMRGFGQIDALAAISEPNIGLITLIGNAHAEMVGSREGILKAKTELFRRLPASGTAIYGADDDFAAQLKASADCQTMSFGFSEGADVRILKYTPLSLDRMAIAIGFEGDRIELELPTVGKHQALNAAAALTVGISCGVSLQSGCELLPSFEQPPMRMQVIRQRGVTILLDTYNASPDSVLMALDALREAKSLGRLTVILGSMKELGEHSEAKHREIGARVAEIEPEMFYTIGDEATWMADEAVQLGLASAKVRQLADAAEVRRVIESLGDGDFVLVKGSRALELERAFETVKVHD